jgi:hypothetical protein
MRGAMINAFGEPTVVLELVDVQEPAGPARGEVLVGAEYAPVNMNDLYVIRGALPVRPSQFRRQGGESLPARSSSRSPRLILCRRYATRFITPRAAEKSSSIFAQRREPISTVRSENAMATLGKPEMACL